MNSEIQLLQFFVCKSFQQQKRDFYVAEGIHSNLRIPAFPCHLPPFYVVTCWRKDQRFHKEVIEYATDESDPVRTPHMDIEPVADSVLFRWHTHRFPTDFTVQKETNLQIRVILDGHVCFSSYLLIEKSP